MAYQITNQKSLRRAFREQNPHLDFSKVRQKPMTRGYRVDTRVAFVDFVDHCARSGIISEALASRATLE